MYYRPWPNVTDCNNAPKPLDFSPKTCHTTYMKNTETLLLDVTPQERLAYAWAVAESHHRRLSSVSERLLARCRRSTSQINTPDCWLLLSEVPVLMGS
jgi:hypothetical protein